MTSMQPWSAWRWPAYAHLVNARASRLVFLAGVSPIESRTELLVPGITVGGQALGESGAFP